MLIPGINDRRALKHYLTDKLSNHNVPFSRWKVVEDESICEINGIKGKGECVVECGHEIVSPKMKLSARSEKAITALCEELQHLKATTNTSTGLHIHIDGTGLTLEQSAHIAMNYAFFESVIDKYVCPSRRADRNQYCLPLPHLKPDFKALQKWRRLYPYAVPWNPTGDKGHKLNFNNLRSWSKFETIENRHHQGSVDAEEILNWIRFNLKMVQQTIDKGLYVDSMANYISDVAKERHLWEFINDNDLKLYYAGKASGIRVCDQFFTYTVID